MEKGSSAYVLLTFHYSLCFNTLDLRALSHCQIQSATNNQAPSQGPATSESNNLPVSRPSSCSGLTKPKCLGGSKDMQFMSQSILMTSESVATISKSDMELLAQNRGNAMQRYKEKKKTRR